MTDHVPNRDPDEHSDLCDHDQALKDVAGFKGVCAECGAKDVCVGCRSSDGECYCDG